MIYLKSMTLITGIRTETPLTHSKSTVISILAGLTIWLKQNGEETFPIVGKLVLSKTKVDSKLESTRGLFVSVRGFRPEVIDEYNGRGAKIIFMSGHEFVFILEGRISLQEALKIKIEKAAQEGITNYSNYLSL